MTDGQIIMGAIIYGSMADIPKDERLAKRSMKAVLLQIKKVLKTNGAKEPRRFEAKADQVDVILKGLSTKFGKENLIINPGTLLQLLYFKRPDLIEVFELKKEHVEDLSVKYKNSFLAMPSLKITNEIINQIDQIGK